MLPRGQKVTQPSGKVRSGVQESSRQKAAGGLGVLEVETWDTDPSCSVDTDRQGCCLGPRVSWAVGLFAQGTLVRGDRHWGQNPGFLQGGGPGS